MLYQSLLIENFRGITNLEITDMKRINLLVGRNNCGKTSVLESLFLLSGMSNPQLPVNIHLFRDMVLIDDSSFAYLFKYCQTDNKIRISGKMDMDSRSIEIKPDFSLPNETEQRDNQIIKPVPSTMAHFNGLLLKFRIDEKNEYEVRISLKKNEIQSSSKYIEKLQCHFLSPMTYWINIEDKINSLIVNKKKDFVVKILKKIEPRIENFEMAGNIIFVDIGEDKLLPMNIMGDGIRRILAIVATISSVPEGIILVDEIETGFHYSSLTILWKAIIEACKEYNVQIVATTHSYECIESLSNSYSELEPDGDDIRLYRIDREENKHKAFKDNSQILKAGIEKEFEVR